MILNINIVGTYPIEKALGRKYVTPNGSKSLKLCPKWV